MKKIKEWYVWQRNGNVNIFDFLNSCSIDNNIVLFLPEEHEIRGALDYKSTFEKFKNITMVLGTYNSNYLYQLGLPKNVKLINFPNFLMYYTTSQHHNLNIPKDVKKTALFSVFVNRADPDRACLFDMLAKHKLLKNSHYSWNQIYINDGQHNYYKPKFWNSEVKKIDITNPSNRPSTLPNIIHNSVIHLAPESTMHRPFITEKTYNAILYKMPFIIYGQPGAHAYVESLGFKLPRNIIKYENFDNVDNIKQKAKLIAKELNRLSSINLNELAAALKPTVDYNFNLLLDIVSKEEIPDVIKNNPYYRFYIDNTRINLEHFNHFR